ncbi:tRNA (adenosine(37)-N6)-threonylcarbamoyltransferase complex dimerization subunit type 1 TsaB [Kiloniella laminariae]|uniref:tRNA (Adenosine(37)-N6)-threonylcarbamoyltransferase complex dimerization subunit type 1 TsaB n=1 Tax=Kiloniella laminariae TaxID=454162 RepID=A0ABT4LJL7_9PROT|nr:tRNA (adenosine(37)-N6)-threonylcarbamoyltransferase complex dimerization subunit type 1 TsaB [Kiloniella laminariae]MCZ4281298.1 tRNA (adenosine(37)-N6)-threonylcarbamoyltransferase complex dimerization subunit type 1 TsaB [Kiloniella laminariae]
MCADDSIFLGLDTAGSSCSVAIVRAGKILASRLEEMRRGQSERLLPMINEVLSVTGLELSDMSGFAVTTGPGGFTGVRIGLAAAQGFALACDKPLVGINNFDVLARAVPSEEKDSVESLTVLLDAKRAELFAQCFTSELKPLTEPFAVSPDQLAPRLPSGKNLLVGDAVEQAEEFLAKAKIDYTVSRAIPRADASCLLLLALEKGLFKQKAHRLHPLYLRAPDVSLPKNHPTGK